MTLRSPTSEMRASLGETAIAQRSVTVRVPSDLVGPSQQRIVHRSIRELFVGVPVRTIEHRTSGFAEWTVLPRVDRLRLSELPTLHRGFSRLPGVLTDRLSAIGGVSSSGHGAATTGSILAAARTVAETAVVPVGVVGVSGLLAIGLLVWLVISAREQEDRLLLFRGASGSLLVRRAAIEMLCIAAPASVGGGLIAQLLLATWYGPAGGATSAVAPVVAAMLVAVLVAILVALPSAFRPLGEAAHNEHRGGSLLTAISVFAVALAGIATWRFAIAPNAVAVLADPFAVSAPALDLVAFALVSALLFIPATRIWPVIVRTGRGLGAMLASRLVASNVMMLTAAMFVIALGVAAGTATASITATSGKFIDDSALAVNGAAARLDFPGGTMINGAADLLPANVRHSALAHPNDVAPVLRTSVSMSQVGADVVAIRAADVRSLVRVGSSIFDGATVASALHGTAAGTLPGPVIPATTTPARMLTATLVLGGTWQADGTSGPVVDVTLWLVDPAGDAVPVGMPAVILPTPGQASVRTAIPQGGPWTIAAADIEVSADSPVTNISVTLTHLRFAGREVLDSDRWQAAPRVFGTAARAGVMSGIGVGVAGTELSPAASGSAAPGSTIATVRVLPVGQVVVPVVISTALAAQTGLHVGSQTELDGTVAGFSARVVGVEPLIPGTAGQAALLADLPTLMRGILATSQQLPAIRELWAASATTANRLAAGGTNVTLPSTTVQRRFVQAAAVSLRLGALGGGIFALIAIAATLALLQRRRSGEALVLRGLGVGAREQAWIRIAEPLSALVLAGAAGIAGGVAAAGLVAPAVARTSAPSAPPSLPVALVLDSGSSGVLLGAFALASLAMLALQYRSTIRQASGQELPVQDASADEEGR